VPHIELNGPYLVLFIATVGTTITPFMQLYLQSAVVERGLDENDLGAERAEVATASVFANLVAGFIIVATGATLYVHGDRTVNSAADAARALAPFAGRFAEALFAVGLLGASLLAAAILPVTAGYVIAETLGFEKGIARRPREAPVFVAVVSVLIAVGAVVALLPGLPVIKLLVFVQVVNGVLLPVTLFFVWRLARDRELMGEYRNGRVFDVLAAATVLATSALSLVLVGLTFAGKA
jgi:Mn2+/Fe2+ NRAMP family transporter